MDSSNREEQCTRVIPIFTKMYIIMHNFRDEELGVRGRSVQRGLSGVKMRKRDRDRERESDGRTKRK